MLADLCAVECKANRLVTVECTCDGQSLISIEISVVSTVALHCIKEVTLTGESVTCI